MLAACYSRSVCGAPASVAQSRVRALVCGALAQTVALPVEEEAELRCEDSLLGEAAHEGRVQPKRRQLPSMEEVQARLRSHGAASCSGNQEHGAQASRAELDWRDAVAAVRASQAALSGTQMLTDTFGYVAHLLSQAPETIQASWTQQSHAQAEAHLLAFVAD